MKSLICSLLLCAAIATPAVAAKSPAISGDYLEFRSCDVYTGPCFANAEMGLTGKEGIMVWSVRDGSWNGVSLKGLNVIAVLQSATTLGDVKHRPCNGRAVIVVDETADAVQTRALTDMAKALSGKLICEVAEIKRAKMDVAMGTCSKLGCASVKAGNLVQINTRCLGGKDHLCGNEEVFYPPLTDIKNAYPVFAEVASYRGTGLNLTWESIGTRGAFMGQFSQ